MPNEVPQQDAAPLVKRDAPPTLALGQRGVQLTTLEDAFRFARFVSQSGMAPRGLKTPEQVLVAMQFGAEAGLGPMAAIRSVAVISGVPSWKGDTALALVQRSGLCEFFEEDIVGEGDERRGVARTIRRGTNRQLVQREFSVKDAKTAKLWGRVNNGEPSPWVLYPDRMLKARARGFVLHDVYPDVLLNILTEDEARDVAASEPEAAPAAVVTREGGTTAAPADPILVEVLKATTTPAPKAATALPAPIEEDEEADSWIPNEEELQEIRARELEEAASFRGETAAPPAALASTTPAGTAPRPRQRRVFEE